MGLQLICMFKLWYLFMMETIANSELHIPTPIHPTPLKQNKDKTENKHKTILLFSFSHVDCVYTVVTFKCLYPFFVYSFFQPSFTL